MSNPSGWSTHRLPAMAGRRVERTMVSRLGRMVISLSIPTLAVAGGDPSVPHDVSIVVPGQGNCLRAFSQ